MLYSKEFEVHKRIASKKCHQRLVSKSEHTSSLLDNKWGKMAAKRIAHTLENVEVAGNIIDATLRTSISHLVQELDVSSSSVYCIPIEAIRLFPYKLQIRTHQSSGALA